MAERDFTMMKQEFEELAGYEVSWDDYLNIIEPMYMATNLDKAEFVKVLDKKRFALRSLKSIRAEMCKLAKGLQETCIHYTDWEAKEKLYKLVEEYQGRIGATSHWIVHSEKFTCYYPSAVEFFSGNENIKSIDLVKR